MTTPAADNVGASIGSI